MPSVGGRTVPVAGTTAGRTVGTGRLRWSLGAECLPSLCATVAGTSGIRRTGEDSAKLAKIAKILHAGLVTHESLSNGSNDEKLVSKQRQAHEDLLKEMGALPLEGAKTMASLEKTTTRSSTAGRSELRRHGAAPNQEGSDLRPPLRTVWNRRGVTVGFAAFPAPFSPLTSGKGAAVQLVLRRIRPADFVR